MGDVPAPWGTVAYSLMLILLAIRSLFIVIYYSGLLMPRCKMFNEKFSLAMFGTLYFALCYLLGRFLFTSFLISFSISVFIAFFLNLLFFKKNINLQLFLLCSFFAVQEISFFMVNSLMSTLGHMVQQTTPILVVELLSIYTTVLIYGLIMYFTLRSIKKEFRDTPQTLSLSELLYLVLPCLLGLFVTFTFRVILVIPIEDSEDSFLFPFRQIALAPIFAILTSITLLVSLKVTIKLLRNLTILYTEEKEKAILKNQIRQIQEQLKDVEGVYTEIKGLKHDMKSHLSNIVLLIKATTDENRPPELDEYVSKFEATLNKFEFVCQTGNSVSDIIIQQKYQEAVSMGVEFTADFIYPKSLSLDVYDLAVILNNSLENAIEACRSIEKSGRYIRLYAFTRGEIFFIEIENSFVGTIELNKHTGLPLTNKFDKKLHGIGLANIKRCANKYLGDIDFQILQNEKINVFRLTIMLQSIN